MLALADCNGLDVAALCKGPVLAVAVEKECAVASLAGLLAQWAKADEGVFARSLASHELAPGALGAPTPRHAERLIELFFDRLHGAHSIELQSSE